MTARRCSSCRRKTLLHNARTCPKRKPRPLSPAVPLTPVERADIREIEDSFATATRART